MENITKDNRTYQSGWRPDYTDIRNYMEKRCDRK
jgi:hypothetical protein